MRGIWQDVVDGKKAALTIIVSAAAIPLLGILFGGVQPAEARQHGPGSSDALLTRHVDVPQSHSEPGSPLEVDTTITLRTTGSNLAFVPKDLVLKQGTRVLLRFENAGGLPHNVVLLRNRSDVDAIGIAALDAGSTDYVPVQHADQLIAYSTLAAPGETVEFTFTVPEAGDYPFICSYPGHFRAMRGTMKSVQ